MNQIVQYVKSQKTWSWEKKKESLDKCVIAYTEWKQAEHPFSCWMTSIQGHTWISFCMVVRMLLLRSRQIAFESNRHGHWGSQVFLLSLSTEGCITGQQNHPVKLSCDTVWMNWITVVLFFSYLWHIIRVRMRDSEKNDIMVFGNPTLNILVKLRTCATHWKCL